MYKKNKYFNINTEKYIYKLDEEYNYSINTTKIKKELQFFILKEFDNELLKLINRLKSEKKTIFYIKNYMLDINTDQYNYFINVLKYNKTLTSISISVKKINIKLWKSIQDIFKTNKYIKNLDLSHNNINDDECKYIKNILKINNTLEKIDLSGNCIQDEGCKYLSEGIKLNNSIKIIDLTWNEINSKGCSYIYNALIKNNIITNIFLSWNNYQDWCLKINYIYEIINVNKLLNTFNYYENIADILPNKLLTKYEKK